MNNNRNKAKFKTDSAGENLTWRTFWDGPEGSDGSIIKSWNIVSFPTIYLIDHRGVIRYKLNGTPGDEMLDALVEAIVKEAEHAAATCR